MTASEIIKVTGMQCNGCEKIIEEAVESINGIHSVKANFSKGTVKVIYDPDKTNLENIQQVVSSKGYTVVPLLLNRNFIKILLSILALVSLAVIILLARKVGHKLPFPKIESTVSNGLVFLFGLITGLHCIGMCGSFIIGYTAKDVQLGRPVFHSHLLYGAGKIISYTLLGALLGFIGSFFRITPLASGISIGIAGVFLILYGLNMLSELPLLKVFRIKSLKKLDHIVMKERRKSHSPFFIGLFSGLIIGCGPLQVMYVLAAGNGSVLEGAKFLALFGLGTLPALIGFGLLARLITNTMHRRFIQISGIILIIMGSMMLSKGLNRAGADNSLNTEQKESCCHAWVK